MSQMVNQIQSLLGQTVQVVHIL